MYNPSKNNLSCHKDIDFSELFKFIAVLLFRKNGLIGKKPTSDTSPRNINNLPSQYNYGLLMAGSSQIMSAYYTILLML
jgi:hypothetical protein